MALIPPETLELIRTRLDIVELVGELVPLTRAGRNMKARCPFHEERSPSFIVSPERQTFHCFGCGEGGDVFSFVMKSENLSFMEAAEKLGTRVGVKISADRELGPQEKERITMRAANDCAAEHYHEILKKDPAASAARRYVAARHVNSASVDYFKLGYAPRNGNLVPAALKKGFTEDILIMVGLAVKRADGSLRDYFFDRLMFPIRDTKGACVGFGGRTLAGGEPKYLNSPESPVFSKSRVLYGLYEGLAETRKARRAHLMEGYMDVISSHQHGLKTACAPLGTALTPEHAALIKRYADAVAIVFDADAAGQTAAVRGAEVALESGLLTRVATVAEGKDPDEFLQANGLAAFSTALEAAVDLVAFKTELLIMRAGALTPEAKSTIAKDVLTTITRCPDEVLKDRWVVRLAGRLGLSEDALRRLGGKAIPARAKRDIPPSLELAPLIKPAVMSTKDIKILSHLVNAPGMADELKDDDVESTTALTIVQLIRTVAPYGRNWHQQVLEKAREDIKPALGKLLIDALPFDDAAISLRKLLNEFRIQKRIVEIHLQLKEETHDDKKTELYGELRQLSQSKATPR